ncbi:unnamed protein product [Mycena citricolor]|uniref:Ion transport domain-containing protein n=1 Tax=Mycena citricolor TaxID=2018698 RepID=A0AAD2HKR0_9AGAR|nr:unnamed protein product [Mycena citricolor]
MTQAPPRCLRSQVHSKLAGVGNIRRCLHMSVPIELTRVSHPSSRFLVEEHARPHSPPGRSDRFSLGPTHDEVSLDEIRPEWRRNLFALVEQPKSSDSAFLVHALMTILILVSAVITILETVPAFHSIKTSVWFGLETSLVALFTIEYITRCIAWSSTWMDLLRWIVSFFGIIDLLSVAPYYLELILLHDTSVYFRFSILRMFRLLRVFRPYRSNHTVLLTIEVIYIAVRQSQHALFAVGFFVVMALTVFSTLLYFAERGTWDDILGTFINTDGDPSQFAVLNPGGCLVCSHTISHSNYLEISRRFVLVTITTVGYGEITPRSFLGRLITIPLLIFGLLLIALPSFVLGREFSMVWERMARESPGSQPESPLISSRRLSPSDDLSNRKLAHNQLELSQQITELKSMVEAQGRLLNRLSSALEGKGKERAQP